MWLISYHIVPKPNSPEFEKSGGAYVNCWILYAWQDGAEHLARYEVEKEWTITEMEEIFWYEIDDFDETHEDKQYFLQSQIDGGCFVYYYYPLDAKDEDDEDFQDIADPRLLKTNN